VQFVIQISPYLLLEADASASPWWQLFCGFEAAVGFEADLFEMLEVEYRAKVIDYRQLLLSPPNTPTAPSPADGATDHSVDLNLSWTGGDLDGGPVTYDVYLEAGDPSPDVLRCSAAMVPNCDPGQLGFDSLYYWQVVARDLHGLEAWGPVWSFETTHEVRERHASAGGGDRRTRMHALSLHTVAPSYR
jgi:hypothetical protein